MKQKEVVKNMALVAATAALAIVIGSHLPQFIANWRGPFKSGDYALHVAKQPYPLTLYGTSNCPHCVTARAYLKRMGVPYNDLVIDQSKSAGTAFKQLKERSVPVLVSRDKLIVGFQQDLYAELIRQTNEN